MASSAHFLDIPLNILPRVLRNHRPDIDGEPVGLADAELSHGTLEHCERALGNVVLEAKQSQRRTTLAGTVKCRCDDVRYDLLSERTGIHDHRSEEHTSELQSLMRISYAVFCLKKKHTNK